MYDNSTRPQRRSHDEGFLTEKGKQKINSFLGEFLTEEGRKFLYSLCSGRRSMVLVPVWLIVFMNLSAIFNFGVIMMKDLKTITASVDSNAVGGADDDEPGSVKHLESIPADIYPGRWVQPLPGNLYITQGKHGRLSDAVDLRAEVGTPVFATRAGRIIVSETGYNNGHGNYIIIDHGDGVSSVYCHLSVLYVEYGQAVAQGQTIGLSGDTGHTTGPHLHFAVRGRGVENPLF